MSELQPSEDLYIPKRKRMTHARIKSDDGQDVLHLFYGYTELIFDEPEVAPLGEKLLEVDQFRAEDAMAWANAEPHSWEKIRELLEALLHQKVLGRVADAPVGRTAEPYPQRLGEAPEGRELLTHSAHDNRCPMITEQAFGHAFDLGNLEVLVPIYRIAHPALDVDGRQVGENNVSPRTLFLDLPTQRKQCSYPGSRYQHDLPMNQTAMKAMSKRWPELLSLTEQFRAAVVERMPPRDPASRTAGELHFIAVCTLASVGYVMVRGVDPVPHGQLDGGLAALFRLLAGVRLVTNDLVRALPDPAQQATSQRRLGELFAQEPIRGELAAVAAAVVALERRRLAIIEREQATLNRRLARPPGRKLTSLDLAAFTKPRNGPPLHATLAGGHGITDDSDAPSTTVRHGGLSLAFFVLWFC